MPSTTNCSRGDIVFVPFLFADSPVAKNRPALVISTDRYNRTRGDIIVAAITSRIRRPLLPGDHLIGDWEAAGLVKPSVLTAAVRTIRTSLIRRTLGRIASRDLRAFESAFAGVVGLRAAIR